MTTVPVTVPEQHMSVPVMPSAAPAQSDAGISVNDVIRILKQRILLIILVWFLGSGFSVFGTYILDRYYPAYQARSVILVGSPNPKEPMTFGQEATETRLMDRYIADQALMVKSDVILKDALASAEVMGTDWYRTAKAEGRVDELVDELKETLVARQVPETNFLAVRFSTKSQEDPHRIVNAVIAKYLAEVKRQSLEQLNQESEVARDEVARVESELEAVRQQKEQFLSQFAVPGVTQGLNVVGETYATLAQEVTRLEAEKLQLKAAVENLRGLAPSEIALSPQIQLLIDQDPHIAGLRNQVMQLEQNLNTLRRRVGPQHRNVTELEGQLTTVRDELDRIVLEKQEEARDYQLNSAETAYLNAVQAELQLRERLLTEQARQEDIDRKMAQYQSLLERQYLLEDQFRELWSFSNQLNLMQSDSSAMVRVRQLGSAQPPREKSFPSWKLFIPAGSMLSLLLGVGFAVLLELLDTSLKTARDVARHVHVPILGTVPDVEDEEVEIDQVELACRTHPRSILAEAFRTIRTNLLLSAPAERQRTVLVTSAKPEEGRTTIATNMAISLAQNGRRVLLVDANFHRPALRNFFPDLKQEGLSNTLIGQGSLDTLVQSTDLPNLDVMNSGPIPPNPAELLAGSYMRDLVRAAGERYDQVIFDGPPVLLITDALVLSSLVDGVVLVCRAKKVSRGVVMRGREQIERVNGRIFGAVLNAAMAARGGYFREQMRNYYEYQPEEALQAVNSPELPRNEMNGAEESTDSDNESKSDKNEKN